jgi:hypothetical protein
VLALQLMLSSLVEPCALPEGLLQLSTCRHVLIIGVW